VSEHIELAGIAEVLVPGHAVILNPLGHGASPMAQSRCGDLCSASSIGFLKSTASHAAPPSIGIPRAGAHPNGQVPPTLGVASRVAPEEAGTQ